jgi:hypothetical protein
VPASPAPRDPLHEESEILAQALSQLDGDPRAALAMLATHVSRFPGGQLAPERECIWIDALDRIGRSDEATARARSVVARFPESPCAGRVRDRARADE